VDADKRIRELETAIEQIRSARGLPVGCSPAYVAMDVADEEAFHARAAAGLRVRLNEIARIVELHGEHEDGSLEIAVADAHSKAIGYERICEALGAEHATGALGIISELQAAQHEGEPPAPAFAVGDVVEFMGQPMTVTYATAETLDGMIEVAWMDGGIWRTALPAAVLKRRGGTRS
jgi:hypothetical protein